MGGRGSIGSRGSPDRPKWQPSASSTRTETLVEVGDDIDISIKKEAPLSKKEQPPSSKERPRSKKFPDLKASAAYTVAAVEIPSTSSPPPENASGPAAATATAAAGAAGRPRHVSTKGPPTPTNRLSWSMLAGARVGSGNIGAASTAYGGDSPGGGLVSGSTAAPLGGAKTESTQDKRTMGGRSASSVAAQSNDINAAFGLRRREDSDEEEWVINGEGQYIREVRTCSTALALLVDMSFTLGDGRLLCWRMPSPFCRRKVFVLFEFYYFSYFSIARGCKSAVQWNILYSHKEHMSCRIQGEEKCRAPRTTWHYHATSFCDVGIPS